MNNTPETDALDCELQNPKVLSDRYSIMRDHACRLEQERDEAREALKEANDSVVTFGVLWAVQYAADLGFSKGHIHPAHYDILQKAGARMNDFTRADVEGDAK